MSHELKCNICGENIPVDDNGTVPDDWGTLNIGLYVLDPNNPGTKVDIMPMQMHVCQNHDPRAIPPGQLEQAVGLALVSCLMARPAAPAAPATVALPAAPTAPTPAPPPPAQTPLVPGQIPRALAS